MTSPELLYAGFDGLDIAFQGCLPYDVLDQLEDAREEAQKTQTPVLVTLGNKGFEAHVHEAGRRGGYRFHLSTGQTGAIYWFKANGDARNWNIFVSIGSAMLLDRGYHGAKDQMFEDLANMGAILGKESVNRVDFAMDFRMPEDFELRVEQFVAHPHAKVSPYMGEQETAPDDTALAPVLQGRKVRTVTIGKMPGRQVITYDKRRDAIAKRKLYWFDVWRVDREDKSQQVWRIEVRAGKHHLKDQNGLSSLEDIEASFSHIAESALERVRYLDNDQFYDTANVSRARCHPLWIGAQKAVLQKLTEMRTFLPPGGIKYVMREQAIHMFERNILGNTASLSVALEIPQEQLAKDLTDCVADLLSKEIQKNAEAFGRKVERARNKYQFS